MYYRIAEVVLFSQIELPSFEAFSWDGQKDDVRLEVTQETPPEGPETSSAQIFHRKIRDGWFFHFAKDSRTGLLVSEDYARLRLIRENLDPAAFHEEWVIRIALECLLIHRGYVSLHAACVELNGKAIAFSGPSGTGKSTRAAAWQSAFDAALISGDRPLIRLQGPEVFGVPWDGKEGCCRNVHYPLSAICEIRRSKSVYARKMTFRQKRQLLMQQCFIPMWDTETAVVQIMNISRLASQAEIIRVFCGPDITDAEVLRQHIDSHQLLKEEPDMKAKTGYVLRHIVGEYMLMPVGDNISKFNGTVLLNEVSAFIWEKLQKPVSREDLLQAVLDEFDVEEAKAGEDLDALLLKLQGYDLIEDMG